ncbi:hypothetical protein QYE76_011310 [Lolium multiflorum]|uniref:Uncharacterized protein n=1 Tax=Lolium multiflorum TaxID=4521 RepID=A0AAD8TYR1_LOLMU|nr:hypothetical protein QYE76_011310 [Lolium multiflorum]
MKMAVEMAAVSMEKPSGALPRPRRAEQTLSPDLGFTMAAARKVFRIVALWGFATEALSRRKGSSEGVWWGQTLGRRGQGLGAPPCVGPTWPLSDGSREQQALHYELHKSMALQRRVTLGQAENIRTLKHENAELKKQLADTQGASSSLATASTELENLRSSYQDLETKLTEAEQKREQAEKQLTEKNSEFIKKEGEFQLKRKTDSDTIQKQQKELSGLRRYMETAEKH